MSFYKRKRTFLRRKGIIAFSLFGSVIGLVVDSRFRRQFPHRNPQSCRVQIQLSRRTIHCHYYAFSSQHRNLWLDSKSRCILMFYRQNYRRKPCCISECASNNWNCPFSCTRHNRNHLGCYKSNSNLNTNNLK